MIRLRYGSSYYFEEDAVKRGGLLLTGLLSAMLIVSTACGAAEEATDTPGATATRPAATTTTRPAGTTPAAATTAPGASPTAAATTPTGGGDLESQGREIFLGQRGTVNFPGSCAACHTIANVPGAVGMIGPDLSHIGTEAANRKPGMSAEDYITESIEDPEAFVPTGVERAIPGLMTEAVVTSLSEDEVQALVAFLIAQK